MASYLECGRGSLDFSTEVPSNPTPLSISHVEYISGYGSSRRSDGGRKFVGCIFRLAITLSFVQNRATNFYSACLSCAFKIWASRICGSLWHKGSRGFQFQIQFLIIAGRRFNRKDRRHYHTSYTVLRWIGQARCLRFYTWASSHSWHPGGQNTCRASCPNPWLCLAEISVCGAPTKNFHKIRSMCTDVLRQEKRGLIISTTASNSSRGR